MQVVEKDFKSTFGLEDPPKLKFAPGEVVVVVLCHNEMLRLPAFLKHYRDAGIDRFVFVDNASTDGTFDYLSSQVDVNIIGTNAPFRSYKSTGRELIADTFLQGNWVIFPDADELLVYPGWPSLPIPDFVRYLEDNDYEALFTTMVDMYSQYPLSELNYTKGADLIAACPYFDPDGYRFNPLKGSHGKKFKTPVRHVFGGTRERVFHKNAKRSRTLVDDMIIRMFYSIESNAPQSSLQRSVDRLVFKLIKNALPDPAAVQSKVQFLKWKKGLRFSGSVHNVWQELNLAPDWGALLHFKYLKDYADKISDALLRKQHTDNSSHYRDYQAQLETVLNGELFTEKSARFTGADALTRSGLMRESKELRRWIDNGS